MGRIRALWVVLLAMALACGNREPKPAAEDPPATAEASAASLALQRPTFDATPVIEPSREQAAAVLRQFAEALLASPPRELTGVLRIPEGLSEKQLAFFYKELRKKHVTLAGVEAVLLKEFGTVSERMGDKAQTIADQAGLMLEETWAFGDLESAAILHWDGQQFWVASVHRLTDPS